MGIVGVQTTPKIQLTIKYRILHDLVDIKATTYLEPASTRTRAQHSFKLRQLSSKTDNYKYSFFPSTIRTWNSLPAAIAEAPDLVHFKQELAKVEF